MRDFWFLVCVAGLTAMTTGIVIGIVVDFLDWRSCVNREAWWRHVTGMDRDR